MAFFRRSMLFTLAIALWLMAGCAGPRSQSTAFYILPALAGPQSSSYAGSAKKLIIGVGPIKFPYYLDRPQIVTGSGPTRLNLAEFHQWAEPLKETFARALAENLSVLLATDHVLIHPWPRTIPVDYQIELEVLQFYAGPEEESRLQAQWRVVREAEVILMKKSTIRIPADTSSYKAIVASQGQTLERFSREIASTLKALE